MSTLKTTDEPLSSPGRFYFELLEWLLIHIKHAASINNTIVTYPIAYNSFSIFQSFRDALSSSIQ